MKIWKSNLVILVLPQDWSTTKKRKKLFAVLPIILRLKFFKERVTLMKSIFGQSESLFTHNWLENLHLKLLKSKPHTKKLKPVVTVSQIMWLSLKKPENWLKESWFWIHPKDLLLIKFLKILSWQVIQFLKLFLAVHLLAHLLKTLLTISNHKLNQSLQKMKTQINFKRKNLKKSWHLRWQNQLRKKINLVAQQTTSNQENKVWNQHNK